MVINEATEYLVVPSHMVVVITLIGLGYTYRRYAQPNYFWWLADVFHHVFLWERVVALKTRCGKVEVFHFREGINTEGYQSSSPLKNVSDTL